MALYLCRLLYPNGKVGFKFLSEEEFTALLTDREVIVLQSFQLPSWLQYVREGISKLSIGRVKDEELIDFAKSMSVMLRAGIPVIDILEDLAEITTNRKLKSALVQIAHRVREGLSLSEAFAQHPSVFSEVFHRVIRIGEETGSLDVAFKDIAEHLERVHELKNNIKRALMYPSFVFVATFGALIFWLVYVLPKIVSVFTSMGLKLPAITLAVIDLSNFMKRYGIHCLALLVLLLAVVWVLRKKSERVAYAWDWLVLRIPIVKAVVTNFQYAYVADFMRLLIGAGSNIDRVLELVAKGVGNRVFKRALERVRESVIMGRALSTSFMETGLFPRLFIRMLRSGEESGTLEEQLRFAADVYYGKLEDITAKMGKMLEPIVLMVVGGMFALMMISLLSPIYDLIGKIGGM